MLVTAAAAALAQSGGQVLYNGIVLPSQWPPSQTPTQVYQVPSYITSPPPVIPIDVGRQLFVDDFLIQQTTMTRTQHQPAMFPLNPILTPGPLDVDLFAAPFSDGVWFDPADRLFKMWYFCGGGPSKVCYAYSTDGKNWIRPSIPDALVPNTNQVLASGLVIWMDLQDPNPARKFKAFAVSSVPGTILLYFSADGIHWTGTNTAQYPIPILYDRSTLFWNPFRNVWVDSMKNYTTLPPAGTRPSYLTRLRNYTESPDLMNWTPLEPANFATSFWTGPDVNDPPYVPGGTLPQLYNLDAVAYESVMVGLFSWYYPGNDDDNPLGLPGPDLVELGAGFSRDGFQWVRPTRGSGPGPNGAFLPASNMPGTWNMGNTQSAGGGFLVVGDELWFYFSGRTALHGDPSAIGSTGLATLRRDGFYSMNAGSPPAVLTTRPVKFSGKYLFVNVKNPQGSLQVQVLNPNTGAVLATSVPVAVDKTLQPITWSNGLADLSGFANQPVQFQFTLSNGELYSFWISASTSGASNGYVAANGPGFTGPVDNLGIGAYPTTVATPEIYPTGGTISSSTNVTILTRTAGATIRYTLDGSTPTASSPVYTAPLHLLASATLKALAFAPGLTTSATGSAVFTVDNTPPSVSIIAPVNGQIVSAGITLSADASHSAGVASVQFLVDGVIVGIANNAPYSIVFETTTVTNATHQITAVATDTIGNQATSAPITVTVRNVSTGPLSGLTGYWSFDSAYVNGTTLFDQSGNNNSATALGTLSVPGATGQALQFDGSSSYTQVTSGQYDLAGDLTLSLWVRTTNSSRIEALLSKFSAGGLGSGYLLRTKPSGTAELFLGLANVPSGTNIATDTTLINDGNWHHLAVVVKLGVNVTFYVDGALSSTTAVNSIAAPAASFFQMGLNPWIPYGTYLTGALDEVRVYNRALSGAEVASLYAPPTPDVTITGAVPVNFAPGDIGDSYTITVSNVGGTATSGTVTVTDTVPSGLTPTGIGGTGWTCTQPAGPCTRSDALGAGGSYPALILTVNVASNAPGSVTNTATVSGGGESNNANNTANYQTTIAAHFSFLTGYNLNGTPLRNNFTGWVGTKFTVGANPLTVLSLGRLCIAGNSGSHTVKLVSANTATDITGGSVTVVMSGCAAGQFVYAALPGPVILRTNTTYYLVSREVSGGDQWYDHGPVSPTADTAVNSSVYSIDGATWVPSSTANTSYVPVNFEYSTASTISVTVQTNVSGLIFAFDGPTYTTSKTFSLIIGTSHTIGVSSPQSGSPGTQYSWKSWSDGGPISHTISITGPATITANFTTQYLLTTSVTPAGGGSIVSAPSTASGYYDAGTSVQLTASPNAGCTFVNWSGDLSGGVNPQTVTMSAQRAVTANFQCSGSYSPFVTGFAQGAPILRNNFTGWVGMKLTVNANPLAVVSIGRICVAGNSGTHTVKFVNAGTGADVPGGLVSVSMSQCAAGQFTYASLSSSVTLQANSSYYLVSQEVNGGDQWYDHGAISSTADAVVNSSIYTPDQATWIPATGTNTSYVPPNFLYSSGSSPASPDLTITKTHSGNFKQGDIGDTYAITVRNSGGAPTSGTVTVADSLPSGLTATAISGVGWNCTPPLGPCTRGDALSPGSSYPVITLTVNVAANAPGNVTNTATVSGGGEVNTSNDTANDLTTITGATITVTVQANVSGPSFTVDGTPYTSSQVFSWIPGASHTIGTATPQTGAAGVRFVFASWSDAGALSHTVAPTSAATFTANFTTQFLLNSGVSLSGGGTIAANPPSATGYYDAGSSVQLTATSNSGYAFVNWTGDLSGAVNPGTVIMTAPRSVAASFQGFVAAITGYALNGPPLRNNFSGFAGMSFTVGPSSLVVSSLGRLCIAGNSGTHTVKLVSAATGADLTGGSVSLDMAGCTPGQFRYSPLAGPIALQATTSYYLVSQELNAGDQFYDFGTVSSASNLTVNSSIYFSGSKWIPVSTANTSYVPPNFQYSVGTDSSFVTAYNLDNPRLRNNFSGWAGMKLTVGASSVVVNSLGRIFVAGNSGTHTIKLVRASDGTDVPGASVTVSMAGGTPGVFQYVPLTTPVTLTAGASYYLVSQEVSGGDQWYDFGVVSATPAAAVNNAVYSVDSTTWFSAGGASTSYVPPNMK